MGTTRTALTRNEVREIDRRAVDEYGMNSLVLMENAGRGAAAVLREQSVGGSVCICCGKGNNGGDGFVIARHLEAWGVPVHVVLFAEPESLRGDARFNFDILKAASTPITVASEGLDEQTRSLIANSDWIVDALLGTGVQGEVRDPYPAVIEEINRAGGSVLAVDIPSGLDCDWGIPLGQCVRADRTVTFVACKRGFESEESQRWTGTISVVEIGVPRQLLAAYNL